MTTGTKAIMAASGGGGESNVLIPMFTKSDQSGSDKHYLNYITTDGNVQRSIDVTSYGIYYTGSGGNDTCFQSTADWDWIFTTSGTKVWAVERLTGTINEYTISDTGGNNQGAWTRAGEFVCAKQRYSGSGTTQNMHWLTINNSGTTPSLSTETWSGWGNTMLQPGMGACVAYDVSGDASFSNFGGYIYWQEGAVPPTSSYNVKYYVQTYSGNALTGSASNIYGPTSNYSRGSKATLNSTHVMLKHFDENIAFYDQDGSNLVSHTIYKFTSGNWTASSLTSPYDPSGWRTSTNLSFDYETNLHTCATPNTSGNAGIYGWGRYYNTAYNSINFSLMFLDKGGNLSLIGDTSGLSDEWYRSSQRFMDGNASTYGPNFSMRRINDDGYVAIIYNDYTTDNRSMKLRIFNNGSQVGSTIDFTFDASVCNKPPSDYSQYWRCNMGDEFANYHSGSNVS